MKKNTVYRIRISLVMFSILFVTCENSKHEPRRQINSRQDTTIYAGMGEFLANPYGIDTFFLDTIKSIKIGLNSVIFITNNMELNFEGLANFPSLQKLEYHFIFNKEGLYKNNLSGDKFSYISQFHLLKDDSIHFFIEENLGSTHFTTGILAKKIPR